MNVDSGLELEVLFSVFYGYIGCKRREKEGHERKRGETEREIQKNLGVMATVYRMSEK